MSSTLGAVRSQVRYHLKDRNHTDYSFSSWDVDRAIESVMRPMANRLRMGEEVVTGAIVISNATDTYTLPGAQAYAQVIRLRLGSTNEWIPVIDRGEFDRWREGITNPSTNGKADPEFATVWEDASQVVRVQFYPWPRKADTVDMIRSLLPSALTTDASVIPFDDIAVEALSLEVAAYLAGKSSPEVLGKLGLNETAASIFHAKAEEAIRESRVRRFRMAGITRSPMTVRGW